MDHPLPISNQPPGFSATPADHALNDPIARIKIHLGDIAQLPAHLKIDAIANAANESLQGGGGVDGAIHRAAGPQLLAYCKKHFPDGCSTGLAKHTPAFDLEQQGIRHILHAVGPTWPNEKTPQPMPGAPIDDSAKLGYTMADNLLASCYTQLFNLANKHNIEHLAIPAISTGIFQFPKQRAAKIAFGHAHGHLLRNTNPQQITFVCYTQEDAQHYEDAINTRGQWMVSRGRV